MRLAREVARIMGVEKAPLLNHYGESIAGGPTIRAFGQDQQFMNTNIRLFDNYGRPCFFNFTLMEWLIFRMELLCSFVFSFAMVLVVLLPDNTISPSLTGLVVTYGLNLNIVLIGVVWNLCNLQTKIISVERIQQYTCIPSEAPLVIESRCPPPSWPSHGTIELQHLQV
jgi:ATP-binding cassette subfamily C (CFTR/MRP) protein 2